MYKKRYEFILQMDNTIDKYEFMLQMDNTIDKFMMFFSTRVIVTVSSCTCH